MAQANLTQERQDLITANDHVVIASIIEAGKAVALNVEGFTRPHIMAGHVIVRDTQNKKEYKPLGINPEGTAYLAVPSQHEVVGVAQSSIRAGQELVSVLVRGAVNEGASPYPLTPEIKQALTLIRFFND